MSISMEDLRAGRVDFTDVVDPNVPAMAPSHPGAILRSDWLEPLGLSASGLAAALKVPRNRVTQILNGERGITADTALRLARYFGTDAQSWLALQVNYDLAMAEAAAGASIEAEVTPRTDLPTRSAAA